MQTHAYHLVNVFAESHFGGNPLAVFPQADRLTDEQMQAIAQQFNLSETVFLFLNNSVVPNDDKAVANLRIFTPNYELPLAGHPTIGSAYILKSLHDLPDEFVINTVAKPVTININQNHVEMQLSGFTHQACQATPDELAKAINLSIGEIDKQAFWLNSGSPQLLLKVLTKDSLFNAKIEKDLLEKLCQKERGREMICLWCEENDSIFLRFFSIENGAIVQDSGTGSACANLGVYFILQGDFPLERLISQGDEMGRPNRLSLRVDSEQNIFVGGKVIKVGQGEFYLPN